MTEVITEFSYVLIIHAFVYVFVLQHFTVANLKNDVGGTRKKREKKKGEYSNNNKKCLGVNVHDDVSPGIICFFFLGLPKRNGTKRKEYVFRT